ncbi:MAG: hypothetical protein ACYC0V_20445 [Armatimonadota bacterium]
MPGLAIQGIPGKISVAMGFAYATEQTTTWGGSSATTSTGGTQTKLSWNADYKYPLGNRFGVGASLLNWKFDPMDSTDTSHGGTSFCFMTSYLMGSKANSEIFLGAGSDLVRIGYRTYAGKNDIADRGLYYSIEFNAPTQDSTVSSFGGVSVGYSF